MIHHPPPALRTCCLQNPSTHALARNSAAATHEANQRVRNPTSAVPDWHRQAATTVPDESAQKVHTGAAPAAHNSAARQQGSGGGAARLHRAASAGAHVTRRSACSKIKQRRHAATQPRRARVAAPVCTRLPDAHTSLSLAPPAGGPGRRRADKFAVAHSRVRSCTHAGAMPRHTRARAIAQSARALSPPGAARSARCARQIGRAHV